MTLHRTLHIPNTLIGICLSLATAASANDGGIAYGGSPRLLNGHPTISMRSEVVRMTVGENTVTVGVREITPSRQGRACFLTREGGFCSGTDRGFNPGHRPSSTSPLPNPGYPGSW